MSIKRGLKIFLIIVLSFIGLVMVIVVIVVATITSFFGHGDSSSHLYYELEGSVIDKQEMPLKDAYITYRDSLVTETTNVEGECLINYPKTLWVEFKSEGYQTVATRLTDFTDHSLYEFSPIALKKDNSTSVEYRSIVVDKDGFRNKQIQFVVTVSDEFGEPLENVRVSLTDTTRVAHAYSNGTFDLKTLYHNIKFEKDGYETISIDQVLSVDDDIYNLNLMLVKKPKYDGIYLLESGKCVLLPKSRMPLEYSKEEGTNIWGNSKKLTVINFFYPKRVKSYKIECNLEQPIRFLIYNENVSGLHEHRGDTNFICSAVYKWHGLEGTRGSRIQYETINDYDNICERTECRVIEFIPDTVNQRYVFVNSTTKQGYFFTY